MASLEKTLEQARIALHNAQNEPQVLGILTTQGYGVERLQEGLALYETARTLTQVQNDARHSRVSATKSFHQIWRAAKLHYHHDLRAARLALKEHAETRYFLQLKGKRAHKYYDWHEQARDFYFGLRDKPELQTLVGATGVTPERANQGLQLLQAVESARLQKHAQKGSDGEMRQERNAAFRALNHWMTIFRHVARFAFAAHPAHLATLGLEPEPRKRKPKEEGQQDAVKKEKVKKAAVKKTETKKEETAKETNTPATPTESETVTPVSPVTPSSHESAIAFPVA